jgi:hypothetical protein
VGRVCLEDAGCDVAYVNLTGCELATYSEGTKDLLRDDGQGPPEEPQASRTPLIPLSPSQPHPHQMLHKRITPLQNASTYTYPATLQHQNTISLQVSVPVLSRNTYSICPNSPNPLVCGGAGVWGAFGIVTPGIWRLHACVFDKTEHGDPVGGGAGVWGGVSGDRRFGQEGRA